MLLIVTYKSILCYVMVRECKSFERKMIQTQWYVITGAPSSGKTTLINRLAQMGYAISPEVARDYINQLLSEHKSLEEIRSDILTLQRQMLSIKLHREHCEDPKHLVFLDRGTPDSIAYFKLHHLDPKDAIKGCQHFRYKAVFYCEGLPIEHDGIRTEDEATAKKIGELIYDAYASLNYPIIELPVIPVEQRLTIILDTLKNGPPPLT
jgi:predicted ATPase